MLSWGPLYHGCPGNDVALRLDGSEVARVARKVTGEWHALLRLLPSDRIRYRDCASRESGMAGAMAWAKRHEAALRAALPPPRVDPNRPTDDAPAVPYRPLEVASTHPGKRRKARRGRRSPLG